MGWLTLAFFIGQVFAWGPLGGLEIVVWIHPFNPRVLPLIGGVLVFAIVPAGALALLVAASLSRWWLLRSRAAFRILIASTVVGTVMASYLDDGGVGFLFFVVPYAVAHIGASLGAAASLKATTPSG